MSPGESWTANGWGTGRGLCRLSILVDSRGRLYAACVDGRAMQAGNFRGPAMRKLAEDIFPRTSGSPHDRSSQPGECVQLLARFLRSLKEKDRGLAATKGCLQVVPQHGRNGHDPGGQTSREHPGTGGKTRQHQEQENGPLSNFSGGFLAGLRRRPPDDGGSTSRQTDS